MYKHDNVHACMYKHDNVHACMYKHDHSLIQSCSYSYSYNTSSCARFARFATCARSLLRFNYFVLWSSASLLLHSTCTKL